MTCDTVGRRDFLRTSAETSLEEYFLAAGIVCKLVTNAESIVDAARQSFLPIAVRPVKADLEFRFWVDPDLGSGPPWPRPYFRGLDHLVYAGFDRENSILMDLRRHRAIGRFSRALAEDRAYWRRILFPALLGISSAALGVAAIHGGCVAEGLSGRGIILAGASGSGKSTLSFSLARSGYAFISDDWTFINRRENVLRAWSVSPTVKLLPDAALHFPELAALLPAQSFNGEMAYEFEAGPAVRISQAPCCVPHRVIFLERCDSAHFNLSELPASAAAARLQADLERMPESFADSRKLAVQTIETLARQECWLLKYGGNPDDTVRALAPYLEERQPVQRQIHDHAERPCVESPDLLRRFLNVLHKAMIPIGQTRIQVETDSDWLLDQIRTCSSLSGAGSDVPRVFTWKLLSEPHDDSSWPGMPSRCVSDATWRLMTLGQCSFVAVDIETRQAYGVVAGSLLQDPRQLRDELLGPLLRLTEEASAGQEFNSTFRKNQQLPNRFPIAVRSGES